MKGTLLILLVTLLSHYTFAHQGELLSINKVKVDSHCDHVVFEFELENVNEILLSDVKIELLAGNTVLYSKKYEAAPLKRFTNEAFVISVGDYKSVDPRDIKIVVTEMFGLEQDWGGWHGIDPSTANYNDVGDFEVYADAPWRMTIYDENNTKRPVPIHVLLSGGTDRWFEKIKPNLEFIDIRIKKSTETTFTDINFNSLSDAEFDDLFSSKSPQADSIGIQSFEASNCQKDANHTFVFKESYNSNQDYYFTNLSTPFWYFTLNLPPSYLDNYSDEDFLDIHVQFTFRNGDHSQDTRNSYLRVFRNKDGMPKLPGFYRGDTHVHTIYSISVIEYGNPLEATKEAAEAIGVDWVIVTDHTASFDEWRGGNLQRTWDRLGEEVDALNQAGAEKTVFIRGQEVSLDNSQAELVHFLAYPGYETPMNLPFLGDGGGDIQFTDVLATKTLERLSAVNGFGYAAHPFATKDEVPFVGGNWNVGDRDFPHDGEMFDVGGFVLCNVQGEPSDVFSNKDDELIFDRLKGAQIWGDRYSIIGEVDAYDPYNIKAANAPSFEEAELDDHHYLNRYRQGEQVINFVNIKGLKEKNENPELKNFKFYFAAGTDAHGSFNYSNTSGSGTAFDDNTEVEVKNLAFGNIACVAYCPDGMGEFGEGPLKALYDGNFTLSDGPILVNGVSLNGDDTDYEVMMGMDTIVEIENQSDIYVNFEYVSTEEFGAATYLKVFVGTEDGESTFTVDNLADYSGNISMKLEDVLDEAGLPITPNKYFYVRSELQTLAEYGANSPRVLEKENFYSFTNPIWINLNEEEVISSINDELQSNFKVYPNPADDVLFIESDANIKNVNIYDAEGKLVSKKALKNNRLDISRLPAGSYTLEAIVDDVTLTKQFIVQ